MTTMAEEEESQPAKVKAAVEPTATTALTRAIAREIALDGGASLATSLKDYVIPGVTSNNKKLNHLIVQALAHSKKSVVNNDVEDGESVSKTKRPSKPKLLTFLELQDETFHVDRIQAPHWVRLVQVNDENQAFLDDIFREATEYVTSSESRKKQEGLKTMLFEKMSYVIRRNHARTERRRAKRRLNDYNESHGQRQEGPSVNINWLLRECTWEFHFWARQSGVYLPANVPSSSSDTLPSQTRSIYPNFTDVKRVGSKEWEDTVIDRFKTLIINAGPSSLLLRDGRVCLIQRRDDDAEEHEGQDDNLINKADKDFCLRLDKLLTEVVVERDGGHQVSLSLLLTRYDDLRLLLGGRDLWKLYEQYSPEMFQLILMMQLDNDLILQSKHSKTKKRSTTTAEGLSGDSKIGADSEERRMLVDEEGQFSIANGKWGKAMANILIRSIEKVDLYSEDSVEEGGIAQQGKVVIDLTAGAGGMTLGLAKTRFFDKVIASEIDKNRADLCHQNMIKHSLEDIVEVQNVDSNELIPELPKQASFVIDCPWGGYGYKKMGGQLFLGDTPLDRVTENIARHCTKCIIGLRLPVTFGVDAFLESLKQRSQGLTLQCLSVNKLQVQLFVVVYLSRDE